MGLCHGVVCDSNAGREALHELIVTHALGGHCSVGTHDMCPPIGGVTVLAQLPSPVRYVGCVLCYVV